MSKEKIYQVAKKLGVNEKETTRIIRLVKIYRSPIISLIIGFLYGYLFGMYIHNYYYYQRYPFIYNEVFLPGMALVDGRRIKILSAISGLIGFLAGSLLGFKFPVYHVSLKYGVFSEVRSKRKCLQSRQIIASKLLSH
ncbi:MAG: hypothetical protein J7L07_09485 [Candidatus Odinarchaeota archaeon]|nr:hypothetical protein [Candidatus Odinarchaeota archaeon]